MQGESFWIGGVADALDRKIPRKIIENFLARNLINLARWVGHEISQKIRDKISKMEKGPTMVGPFHTSPFLKFTLKVVENKQVLQWRAQHQEPAWYLVTLNSISV